jgi:hypothetical protein
MIKKTTLLVLLCAVVLGGVVYYFDWKHAAKEKPPEDASKLAFSIQADDISSFTFTHPANAPEPPIHFVKQSGIWQIDQQLQTQADASQVQTILDGLASARVSQTEPGSPDRLKVYGLDPPQMTIEFQLKNGTKHTVKLGNKDFTGVSVYAIVDAATDVALLPESLLIASDKPLKTLRDPAVLHFMPADMKSFDLKNSSGQLSAAKSKENWEFTKPNGSPADDSDVNALLTAISTAKMTGVVSETAENLAKYGLASPAVAFTVTDGNGTASTLAVGKKDGNDYFARDSSRPIVFHINEALYKKLSESYKDLRSKKLIAFDAADVTRVEIRNANGTVVCVRNKDNPDEWSIDSPDAVKGKKAAADKFFTPLVNARASEVEDHPAPNVAAMLAKPAIEVVLTTKDAKNLTIHISDNLSGFVYIRTSRGPEVYKVNSEGFGDWNFKPADLAS